MPKMFHFGETAKKLFTGHLFIKMLRIDMKEIPAERKQTQI